jgi:hypothetical protein
VNVAENFASKGKTEKIASMSTIHDFSGPERRRNKMFVTRNTEYFLVADVCVAVRDRRTGAWLEGHLAVGRALSGGVKVLRNGEAIPVEEAPQVGEALYFSEGGRELITSVLCSVERPSRELAQQYAA